MTDKEDDDSQHRANEGDSVVLKWETSNITKLLIQKQKLVVTQLCSCTITLSIGVH
jgi:hypothetical protein